MRCTWQDPPDNDCPEEAAHPQVAKDGEVWANLCDKHAKQLDEAVEYLMAGNRGDKGPKGVLSSWVRASGGAAKMAKRMMR